MIIRDPSTNIPFVIYFNEEQFSPPIDLDGNIMTKDAWDIYKNLVNDFYLHHDIDEYKQSISPRQGNFCSNNKRNTDQKIGYVYFVKADTIGMKIGCTSNLKSRIKSLQTASPHELNLVDYVMCLNYPKIEELAHKYFEKQLIRGEWYDIGIDDIKKFINQNQMLFM